MILAAYWLKGSDIDLRIGINRHETGRVNPFIRAQQVQSRSQYWHKGLYGHRFPINHRTGARVCEGSGKSYVHTAPQVNIPALAGSKADGHGFATGIACQSGESIRRVLSQSDRPEHPENRRKTVKRSTSLPWGQGVRG